MHLFKITSTLPYRWVSFRFILVLISGLSLLFTKELNAQVPQAIPYQAIARDVSGGILSNQTIGLQFSIHDATLSGTIVYQEAQSVTTNALGLFTCNLGEGTPIVGTLSAVTWGSGLKFLQVEMDATGGTTYTDMGTTQLMSVPYALHAGSSDNTWSTAGNSGTNNITNALGTNDATDLVIKTDNFETARLFSNPETGGGINPPTDRLRLMRSGAANQKWPMVASFQIGSYEANIEGRTQLDIALLNGPFVNPDTKVMSLLANGNVGIGNTSPTEKLDVNGIGKFGNHLKIGTDVAEGYFQNSQDGAYRALQTGGNQGYWFQNYNGINTSMYVGLNGAYQGKVGIGTTTPAETLDVQGSGRFSALSGSNKRPVFADITGKLTAGIDSVQSFSTTPNAVFNNYFESTIEVIGEPVISSNLISVHLNYQNDNARIFLKSPSGEILNLVSIGNGLFINVDATFNDNGSSFPVNQTSLTGNLQPAADMSVVGGNIIPTVSSFGAFGGGSFNPNGTWTLILWTVYNVSNAQLNNWSITFTSSNQTQGNGYHPKWNNGELSIYSSIYDNGKVGINTTNPQRTLDVKGDIAQGIWTDNLPSRRIGVMDANTHVAGMEIENTTLSGNYSQKLHLLTHHYANGFGRRMTIDEDGRVGIGTETPDNLLTVNGSTNITGNIGIGVSAPVERLEVNGDARIAGFTVGKGPGSYGATYPNAAFGVDALMGSPNGFCNTAIGYKTISNNYNGAYNTALGTQAMQGVNGPNTTAAYGYMTTAIGCFALLNNSYSLYNTCLGGNSTAVQSVQNSTAIGYGSYVNASNQIRFGNPSVNSIGSFVNWTNISDARVKKHVQANVPGLAFINRLTPVTYNLDITSMDHILQKPEMKDVDGKPLVKAIADYNAAIREKERIVYSGFIAQDVEKAAKELNYDFSGVDAAKNDKDLYGLRYAEFVVPLVKSVQELSNENDSVKKENEVLRMQLEEIRQRLERLEKK